MIATAKGLDFDQLQMRLHPAASRVAKLAAETPAAFVAFDLLAADGIDLRDLALESRRERLERLLSGAQPPLHLTPATRDRAVAAEWLERFEGAGLDGVIAKPISAPLRARAPGDAQDQARAHGRLRGRRVSAGTRRARASSDRCCSDCTT